MKTMLVSGFWLGVLVFSLVPVQAASPAGWPNQAGLQLVSDEGEEVGWALYGSRDLTRKDRLFLQIESQSFEDSRRWTEAGFLCRTGSDIDALEFEFGYLRRLTPPDRPWGIHAGPSLGVAFDSGTFYSRTTETGDDDAEDDGGITDAGTEDDTDGGEAEEGEDEAEDDSGRKITKAAGDTISEAGDVEYDPIFSLYAVVMADWVFSNHLGLNAVFSYGYSFETDGKFKYKTGDRRTESFTADSDTFWNFALGVTYAF